MRADMDRCKGCPPTKEVHQCKLTHILSKYPKVKIDCPCFECLVKVTCRKQCYKRRDYFVNNIMKFRKQAMDNYEIKGLVDI